MPAQTMHVGPTEIKQGDLAVLDGKRLEVVGLAALGVATKRLRFHDGTRLTLRRDDELLVHRPTNPPSPGGACPRGRVTNV